MTNRLSQAIEAIGLATGGELGARFVPRLGIVTRTHDHPSPHYGPSCWFIATGLTVGY